MQKNIISLSPKVIAEVNGMLTDGVRVQVDYNPKTRELAVYEVPRLKLRYKVVVPVGAR